MQRQDSNLHDLHIGQMKCHPRLPFPSLLHIARLFRAVNQALQILFSPKLHIAGMTITHSPLALWTFGFTLCSYSLFNCLTHRGCLIFLSRIVPSAALWDYGGSRTHNDTKTCIFCCLYQGILPPCQSLPLGE